MPPNPAPWRTRFLPSIQSLPSKHFVLSTQHPTPTSSPRARTVIYRGLWAVRPTNAITPDLEPLNPDIYDSDCLVITTDVRMQKVSELFSPASEHSGSGGGGPFEAVFYNPVEKLQWRFRGKAYVLAPDIEDESDGPIAVREALSQRMRRVPAGLGSGNESWSWKNEITAHFRNLSPVMRGSFRNPAPGTPRPPPGEGGGKDRLGGEVHDIYDPVARANFRVVVLVPDVVDFVDLGEARRWVYSFVGGQKGVDGWEVVEVWP